MPRRRGAGAVMALMGIVALARCSNSPPREETATFTVEPGMPPAAAPIQPALPPPPPTPPACGQGPGFDRVPGRCLDLVGDASAIDIARSQNCASFDVTLCDGGALCCLVLPCAPSMSTCVDVSKDAMDGSVDAPDAPDEVLEAGDVAIEGNDAPQGPDGATDGAPGGG